MKKYTNRMASLERQKLRVIDQAENHLEVICNKRSCCGEKREKIIDVISSFLLKILDVVEAWIERNSSKLRSDEQEIQTFLRTHTT